MEEKEKVDISDLSIYYQELLFQNEEMKRIMRVDAPIWMSRKCI